ncbi:MAG TPA: inorganic phosphate transporter, partial [Rhizobiaceae bacterium]|nr:inorganic phosphate transporter [Rhizobiaceae bacterium]
RVSAVRWNVARGIVVAWVVTMPAAGILSALAFLAAGPFLR